MRPLTTIALWLWLLTAIACGSSASSTANDPLSPLDQLRARASAAPRDPALWRELAEAEMYGDGGEPERARAAVDHALTLAPESPMLLALSATEHEQHGRLGRAFEVWSRAIDLARSSQEPGARYVAEVGLGLLGHLGQDVPGSGARIAELARRVFEEPMELGLPARITAQYILARDAEIRGDAVALHAVRDASGCLRSFRVAGPFGPDDLLTFDESLPAEGLGALDARYEHGGIRGSLATREVVANGCSVGLDAPAFRLGGGYVAESFIDVPAAGEHFVFLRSTDSFILRVDGEDVLRVDRRREVRPHWVGQRIPLAAGRHELEVKVATRSHDPRLRIWLGRTTDAFNPGRGVALPEADGPFSSILRAWVASARGDVVQADETLRRISAAAPTAPLLLERGAVAYAYPLHGDVQRSDAAHALYRRAAEVDPTSLDAARRLVGFEPSALDAIAAQRSVVERWPHLPSLHLDLAGRLTGQGDVEEARSHIDVAGELDPESCVVLRRRFGVLWDQGRITEGNDLVEQVMSCDASSDARLKLAFRRRAWDAFAEEFERLRPFRNERAQTTEAARLARARGDTDALAELLAFQAERYPYDKAGPLGLADLELAQGRHSAALRILDEAHERAPVFFSGLRQARRAIDRDGVLERHRIDGLATIQAFRDSGRSYPDAAQLLVLDYAVRRYYRDASSSYLVHQVIRVQSEEALRRLGQLGFDARILKLRVIKEDGSILEPDTQTEGRFQMPSLAVGDYVEYEWIRELEPNADGSFSSSGWWFQSDNQPFEFSKLVLIAPEQLAVEIDARGPVPPMEDRREGGLRIRSWTARAVEQFTDEPGRAGVGDDIPHIYQGVASTWDRWFERVRARLVDLDVRDPRAEVLVRDILREAGATNRRDKARALFRWVTESIEPGGGFFDQAAVSLAARKGHRTRVLRYMLGLAGLRTSVAVVAPYGNSAPGTLARRGLHGGELLWVHGRDGGFPLWADGKGLPFGLLPMWAYGREAILIEEGLPRVAIPAPSRSPSRSEATVDVHLHADGSATIEYEQRFFDWPAVDLRSRLVSVPEAERDPSLSAMTANLFGAGGEARDFALLNIDAPEEPLILRATVDVPNFARDAAGQLVLPAILPFQPVRQFAALPERRTPELLFYSARRVIVRIRSDAGALTVPADVDASGPHGSVYQARALTQPDGSVTLVRIFDLPRMIVTPAEYPAFAAFCQEAGAAEVRELAIRR